MRSKKNEALPYLASSYTHRHNKFHIVRGRILLIAGHGGGEGCKELTTDF